MQHNKASLIPRCSGLLLELLVLEPLPFDHGAHVDSPCQGAILEVPGAEPLAGRQELGNNRAVSALLLMKGKRWPRGERFIPARFSQAMELDRCNQRILGQSVVADPDLLEARDDCATLEGHIEPSMTVRRETQGKSSTADQWANPRIKDLWATPKPAYFSLQRGK